MLWTKALVMSGLLIPELLCADEAYAFARATAYKVSEDASHGLVIMRPVNTGISTS